MSEYTVYAMYMYNVHVCQIKYDVIYLRTMEYFYPSEEDS